MAHQTRIKMRRDHSSNWLAKNPILADGEPGCERDTRKIKVGNGFTPWNELSYIGNSQDYSETPVQSAELVYHIEDPTPHPAYDDGPSLELLYQNAKV